jgi:hypothetical protein
MTESKDSIRIIIAIAITILLGVILVQIIAEQIVTKTQVITVTNEVNVNSAIVGVENKTLESVIFTVSNPPTTWRQSACPLSSVSITNYTGAALAETTTWVMDKSAGTFYLKNSSAIWNGFFGVYSYLYFDGVNDYINISDNDVYSPNTTGELSVSFWVKPSNFKYTGISEGFVNYISKTTYEPSRHTE